MPPQLNGLGEQALRETAAAFARQAAASSRQVDTLIADFQSGALSAVEARRGIEAKMVEVLSGSGPRRARRQLCSLLQLQEEKVQSSAVNRLKAYFWISFLAYDVEHDQLQEIIDIEKGVSVAIESHLRKGGSKELLGALLDLYQEVLDRLWLLPYLVADRASQARVVEQDGPSGRAERWIELLAQRGREDQELHESLLAVQRALQRVGTRMPEHIVTEITMLKLVLQDPFLQAALGDVYREVADWRRAIACYRESLAQLLDKRGSGRSEEHGSVEIEGTIYSGLGNAYQSLGQYQEAITYHEKHSQIAQQLGNRGSEGKAYGNLGNAYFSLGQYQQAITYYERDLQIAQQLGDRSGEGKTYGNLGNAYLSLGQYQQAISYYEKHLQIAQQLGDRSGEGKGYGNLGNAYFSLGQYQQAITYYGKDLQIAQQRGDRSGEGRAYGSFGNAYQSLGQYQQAISYQEKALQIVRQLGDRGWEGCVYGGLGEAYQSLGQYQQAISYHEKHLQIAQQLGGRGGEGQAYGNLGNAYKSLGQYQEAITYHEKRLQIAQQLGDRGGEGRAYGNLGNAYHYLGQYREAIAYHEKDLQIAQQLGDRGGEGKTYGNLGNACNSLGQYQQAITYHEKHLQIAQQLGDRAGEGNAYLNLGNAYRGLANFSQAEEYYRHSIAICSCLQQELTEQAEWKITIFEEQSKAHLLLEDVLLRQGKEQQALEASDFRRSRALVSLLLSKFSSPKDLPTAHHPLTAAEIQRLANRQNTTCLIYALLLFSEKVEIGVWVVPPQGEIRWQLLSFAQAVGQDFEKIGTFFGNFPFRNSEEGGRSLPEISLLRKMYELTRLEPNSRAVSSDLAEQFREGLKSWYKMLISPIENYLPDDPKQTLTIIPDSFLSQLPFAAFQDVSGNYLIEQHPVVILPSLQTLHSLTEHPAPRPEGALVVGNPQTTAKNLPEAEREAQTIAPLLGLAADQVLIGEAASVQQVMERIQQARWIHFACHGEPDITPPDYPHSVFEGRLLLASDEEHAEGSLYAHQVAKLQLDAELVCMSACYSGTGKMQSEGSIGLVWSFLAAGARATLATYWPLPDTALTVRMVQKFYEQVLGTNGEKVSKAHALQEAMQMAIEEARDRPDQWGAFFLSGLV